MTGSRPLGNELDASLEPLRKAVDAAFAQYVSEHYPSGASTTYSKDGEIVTCVSSARFNPGNFWNGSWRATYSYSNGKLNIHYKIVVHYYEDGNVQLNTDTVQSFTVETGVIPLFFVSVFF